MFGRQSFIDCVTENLEKKGYGKKKIDDFLVSYKRRVAENERAGMSPTAADVDALRKTLDSVTYMQRDKLKAANKQMEVAARTKFVMDKARTITTSIFLGDRGAGLSGNPGAGIARGAAGMIEADARVSTVDLQSKIEGNFYRYANLLGDFLDVVRKGALGRQVGKMHIPNIVREVFGEATGDGAAKSAAKAIRDLDGIMVDDFNRAGGSLRKRADYFLPQEKNAAKVSKMDREEFVRRERDRLAWDRMFDEEGNLIPVADRDDILRDVYDVLSTDGGVRISATKFKGRGSSIGNLLDKHRFLVYKDADSWMASHTDFGDGTPYDVMMNHVYHMARQTALVDQFGRNPGMWIDMAQAYAERMASDIKADAAKAGKSTKKTQLARDAAEEGMRRTRAMFDVALHRNAINPNNNFANTVHTTNNVLTAAMLGGATILAVPSDLTTSLIVKKFNGMTAVPALDALVKGMVASGQADVMARQFGFISDEVISANFIAERYGMAGYGPQVSRQMTDAVLRMTGLNRWTNTMRFAARLQISAHLDRLRLTKFDDLGTMKLVMQRYGISARDWEAVRTMPAWTPPGQAGVTLFRPLDIMNSKLIDRDRLYQKFFGLIDQESKYMVPTATHEASVIGRGTTRPDTIAGAVLHSFSMYKNYPLTIMMNYGRLAMSGGSMSPLAFIASMTIGMTMVGAAGLQMREVLRGKTPLPMNVLTADGAKFWGRSLLTGGALGVWGDYLFGPNEYGRGLSTRFAGPMAGFLEDTIDLTVGQPFRWAENGAVFDGDFQKQFAQFARRYTPGTSVWWARVALERELWDRLDRVADPRARAKQAKKAREQQKEYGNSYYLPPGSSLFD